MTTLPAATAKKLGLVIDLDTCVGCQACATSCKEWNNGGYSAPLTDQQPYGADPHGAWLNRVHSYEVGDGAAGRTVHFPRSCLHCETPACVTVCPTGASYKRASDEGQIEKKADASGYPASLALLVEGVTDKKDPQGSKVYFLRRIPKDPISGEEWGLRSYASPADSPQAGKDVYDVYSRSDDTGLNRIPYRDW